MQLRAFGYGSIPTPLTGAEPSAAGNRVAYSRPGLQEWYANGPLGIEQGFTVAHAPAAHVSGPLTLAIGLSGNTQGALEAGGHGLVFRHDGKAVIRYTGLAATDARGRALESWLSLEGGQVLLHVDAARAPYPVRIDPFLQEGEKLTGSGESGLAEFGESVALSSDGNTALIGGSGDHATTALRGSSRGRRQHLVTAGRKADRRRGVRRRRVRLERGTFLEREHRDRRRSG